MSAEGWAAPGRGHVRHFHYFRESALMSLCGRQVSLGTVPRLDVAADLGECPQCCEMVNRLVGKKSKATSWNGPPSPRVKVGAW